MSRNSRCICGSGRKQKDCCVYDNIASNKLHAFDHDIGKLRYRMALAYTEKKIKRNEEIKTDISKFLETQNLKSSCKKNCSYCCNHIISSNLTEAECAVFYLYNDPKKLNLFVKNFENWKKKIDDSIIDYYAICESVTTELRIDFFNMAFGCPFLDNKKCMIYPIRPWLCSEHVVTSPPKLCRPSINSNVLLIKNNFPMALIDRDPMFFTTKFIGVAFPFAVTVNFILRDGFKFYEWLSANVRS